MFVNKQIQEFQDVRIKYHLYPNDMSSGGMNITNEDVCAFTEEMESRNTDIQKCKL